MNLRASALVRQGQGAQRLSPWWLAWIVVMVIIVGVPPLGISVGNAVLGEPATTSGWYPYVGAFGSVATLAALWLWVRFREGRPLTTVGFRPRRSWWRLLPGFGIGAIMISVGVGLGLVLGVYGNGHSSHPLTGPAAMLPLLPLTLLSVFQAAAQAALGPGYLLQTSAGTLPSWIAILGPSILLTVLHSLNPVSMLNMFLFALFAALVTLQQGSLWLAIGVQAGWACFQSAVLGLPVGGMPAPSTVLSLGPVPGGSVLVGGGNFGPETGLLATAVLAVATVVAYLRFRRSTTTSTSAAGAATTISTTTRGASTAAPPINRPGKGGSMSHQETEQKFAQLPQRIRHGVQACLQESTTALKLMVGQALADLRSPSLTR